MNAGSQRGGGIVARAAGLAILAALAGVFIFLAIEGVPGFFQEEQFYKRAGNFWGYIDQLLFGTCLRPPSR